VRCIHVAVNCAKAQTPSHPFGSSAIVGSFGASDAGVAEESEDPWLCAPGFHQVCLCRFRCVANCGLKYRAVRRTSSTPLLGGDAGVYFLAFPFAATRSFRPESLSSFCRA